MAKHINVKLSDEQYERLRRRKDWHGLRWVDMLELGYDQLSGPESDE